MMKKRNLYPSEPDYEDYEDELDLELEYDDDFELPYESAMEP